MFSVCTIGRQYANGRRCGTYVIKLAHEFLPVPASLVITVIGGAKNFKLDGKKREVFNRGLVNVSFGKTCIGFVV